jgi:hypothetical protein
MCCGIWRAKTRRKKIKSRDFDAAFEKGEVTQYLDLKSVKARYPMRRISIDFTKNILDEVDLKAARIGVTRISLIKMWIAERLSAAS